MTIFTSFQPSATGSLQLGNLLGALLPFKQILQDHPKEDAYLSIASFHATTQKFNPADLKKARFEMLASFHACGFFEHQNLSIFDQCHNPFIGELHTLLSHNASLGPLEIMTQFKEKGRSQNRDEVPFGLLSYPILMSADILSLQAQIIPVGSDQNQHLQFARHLIKKINKKFNLNFPIPQALLQETPKIMDLKDPYKKMSKTQPAGALFLEESLDDISKKIKRATTDSDYLPQTLENIEKRPACFNLLSLYAILNQTTLEQACQNFAGLGYQPLKEAIIEAYIKNIYPISQRLKDSRNFLKDKGFDTLYPNNEKAFKKSQETLLLLKEAMGLL